MACFSPEGDVEEAALSNFRKAIVISMGVPYSRVQVITMIELPLNLP
ncbi:MAG: hypothetical protein SCG84_06810 [Nitrosomonadaceae bacterium]|nr:hypothetical protein [Nitrosospira sp.]MDW7598447.1 hypothetical protein [Nitrosomonadaceae bacterium]MBI0410154.1 hypothetical protein [Nitrosospira sp.]MBI0411327.1 hypothetical protein [Nitrosospira sp.]MBI0421019.1 hypothetical protein [Nitrosospira sp.]